MKMSEFIIFYINDYTIPTMIETILVDLYACHQDQKPVILFALFLITICR